MGQQVAEDPVLVGGGHEGFERDIHLSLLHEVEQGVHVFVLEVGEDKGRRVGVRVQHQRAGRLGLHLTQQLGDGLACIGGGDKEELHAKGRGHALQDAAVGGGQIPAQCQRDAGVLVACDMCFHIETSFKKIP